MNNHAPDPHTPPFWQNYGKYIVPNKHYNNYGHHSGYNSPHGYHGNTKVTFNCPRTNQLTFNKYQYGHIELAVNTDSDSALTSDGLSDSSTSDLFDHFHPGNYLHGKNTVGFVNLPCNNGCGYSNYNNCNSCNYNNNYNNNYNHGYSSCNKGYGYNNNYGCNYNQNNYSHNNYGCNENFYDKSPGCKRGVAGYYKAPKLNNDISFQPGYKFDNGDLFIDHKNHGHLVSDDEYTLIYDPSTGLDPYGNRRDLNSYTKGGPYTYNIEFNI